MSRLGKMPIEVPTGVKTVIENGVFKVEGPKGKLNMPIPSGIELAMDQGKIIVRRLSDEPDHKSKHGLIRTLAANMVKGAATGYERQLEIVGVGFKAALKGKILNLQVGFSHQIDFEIPEGVAIKVDGNTKVTVSSADKALVGETAAKIRGFRPPEPYQGKGIKYADEKIRRKAGKAAAGGK